MAVVDLVDNKLYIASKRYKNKETTYSKDCVCISYTEIFSGSNFVSLKALRYIPTGGDLGLNINLFTGGKLSFIIVALGKQNVVTVFLPAGLTKRQNDKIQKFLYSLE